MHGHFLVRSISLQTLLASHSRQHVHCDIRTTTHISPVHPPPHLLRVSVKIMGPRNVTANDRTAELQVMYYNLQREDILTYRFNIMFCPPHHSPVPPTIGSQSRTQWLCLVHHRPRWNSDLNHRWRRRTGDMTPFTEINCTSLFHPPFHPSSPHQQLL